MKKVYLIYECSGSWEDYREYLIDARFDKDESDNKLSELRIELENKRQKLLGLEVHLDNCSAEGGCKKCNEYWELEVEILMEDINGYIQDEVEVLEKGEGDIDV